MGYLSTVTGRIAITPPIPLRDVALSAFINSSDVKYDIETAEEEVSEGTLVRRRVVAIVPFTDDRFTAYDLVQHLTDAVREVAVHGSECTGWLIRKGEQQGDIERLRIADGRVVVEKARLIWPDGTVVEQ